MPSHRCNAMGTESKPTFYLVTFLNLRTYFQRLTGCICLCKAHTVNFQRKVFWDKAPSMRGAPDGARCYPSGTGGGFRKSLGRELQALALISVLPSGQMFSIGRPNEDGCITSKQTKRKGGVQSEVVTEPSLWSPGKQSRGEQQSGGLRAAQLTSHLGPALTVLLRGALPVHNHGCAQRVPHPSKGTEIPP